jgi:AmmeMemoRadiSam system protein A
MRDGERDRTHTEPRRPPELTPAERMTLLALARSSVEASAHGRSLPAPGRLGGRLDEPGAAFVSIHTSRGLRGCIGCVEPGSESLAEVVVRMAEAAASRDPRFPPLFPDELPDASIEISVLGPLVPVTGPDDIRIGRDGLVVERDGHRGLLLPQVAVEWGWDVRTFLAETCRKAGLPPTAWREGARVYRFEAEVFGEPAPRSRPA